MGSISVCSVSAGCTSNLTNATTMYEVAGVAMDNSGNCWASAWNPSSVATLTYFAGCAGSGVLARCFQSPNARARLRRTTKQSLAACPSAHSRAKRP
jgi:hypothetical protein